ncbi:MAG: dethiobiotin synthase [Gemmataceae bacterium]|nr:dethiobiotin synthase [Gemmataceae bacterium]MDW8264313.1 dethiobiotin synthase [Gemmataceae bacterium]
MAGLLITGTDTGVGKTVFTAALARHLRRQGVALAVCKPVATGAEWVGNRWLSEDTRRLGEASGCQDYDRITPWSFPEPAAPPVAARQQGVSLSLEKIAGAVRSLEAPDRFVLVEGVGGLLCPLTDHETVADLAQRLGYPLIVVARRALGTLNHTLLTLEVARSRRLPLAGVVVSETMPPRSVAERTNVDELRRRIGVPLLTVLPHRSDDTQVGEALAGVDWRRLALQQP